MLIIGDGGTGKTSFRKKIIDPHAELPQEKDTTFGIEVKEWQFPTQFTSKGKTADVNFHVNFWDFGGQKIYRGTHQIFFTEKSYYVLVADTREQGTDFSYWLNTVQQLGGEDCSVLVLINKKFGHEEKFDERGFRGHFGKIIKDVFYIDLKNDIHLLEDLQNTVKKHLKLLPGIGDSLPPSWVKIREALLEEEENFISFKRFQEICKVNGVENPGVYSYA